MLFWLFEIYPTGTAILYQGYPCASALASGKNVNKCG